MKNNVSKIEKGLMRYASAGLLGAAVFSSTVAITEYFDLQEYKILNENAQREGDAYLQGKTVQRVDQQEDSLKLHSIVTIGALGLASGGFIYANRKDSADSRI